MKRVYPALLIVSVLACGGGGSGPIEPPPAQQVPPGITGGTFVVTSKLTFNECDQTTVWDGTYNVEIDSLSFSMGPWTGTWDPAKARAAADSEKDSSTTRSCTVTRWSSIYITFSTRDKFSGSVIYRLRLGGECGDRTTCTTSWTVVGTRQTGTEETSN